MLTRIIPAFLLLAPLVFEKGFGTANMDTGDPAQTSMLFRVGSRSRVAALPPRDAKLSLRLKAAREFQEGA